MYYLTRLSLKNWYLCTVEDVEYRGSVGMVGPTGAGKSSVLDAIQTVLCGASHNRVHLNASSEGRSERKILDYCLGFLTPRKDGGEPLRPACESILALTFTEERPDGTRHHVSVGVVMTAREDETREMVVTRFIAPGIAVSTKDWHGVDDEGAYVKDWDEIGPETKRRCGGLREYHTSAERFVSDMLAEMRRGARQPDVKRFLNAFFNALAFKPIDNPTIFMREFILERDDLNIERVRDQVARWRGFKDAAVAVEKKLEALHGVTRSYETWGRAVLRRVTAQHRMASAAVERRRLVYAAASKALKDAEEAARQAEQIRGRMSKELAAAREELDQKKATLAEKGIDGRLRQIELERKLLAVDLGAVEAPVAALRNTLRAVSNLTTVRDHLPGSFMPSIAAATAALSIIDAKPGLDWLRQSDDIAQHVAKLRTLASLPERLQPQTEGLAAELARLRQRRDELQGSLGRAGQGRSTLSGATQALMRLLEAEGIQSEPLCDVVEVDDESWQLAVESLLGLRREALIVEPAQVRRAHEVLYRNRNGQGLHNCRLVKTTRTAEVSTRVAAGSIASVVRSDNRHAMAYLVTHLGNCQMAENEEELERASRAIMRNGKATSSLDYSVHRDQGIILVLGRTARERSAGLVARELEEVGRQIADKQRLLTQLDQAAQIAVGASDYQIDLAGLAFAFDEVMRKGRELDGRRNAVLSVADRALADEIKELEAEIGEREREIEGQDKQVNQLAKATGVQVGNRDMARTELRKAVREKRSAIREFTADEVVALVPLVKFPEGEKFHGAANPYLGNKLALRGQTETAVAYFKSCEEESAAALRDATPDKIARLGAAARNRMLEDYCKAYTIEPPHVIETAPYHWEYAWVVRQRERLEKHELREHLDRVQVAETEMVLAIKEDLLSRLTDKFGLLDNQLRALNGHLRKHRFTGQVYKFGKKADPAFDKIRKLAFAVKENPDEAQAIIEKRHDDPALREAMTDLETYINESGGSGLEDYRRYYSFDLYMLPEEQADDDVETVTGRMSLSARAKVGSGGETQAPFYVAMAASMAMAYFPGGHPATGPSGMGLVLFDEAFEKLDVPNTQALVRFFADLGLQLMVAAPEGERPTFTEVFDTMVTVSKSVATRSVYIASDFPKERARAELAAINPNHKGIEGFRAELTQAQKAVNEPAAAAE